MTRIEKMKKMGKQKKEKNGWSSKRRIEKMKKMGK
jgi:hypothetical protein